MPFHTNRRLFLTNLAAVAMAKPLKAVQRQPWDEIAPYFKPPEKWRGKSGKYRSPLLFNDGSKVKTSKEWTRRRTEILKNWQDLLGHWPALITNPKVQVLEEKRRENFRQLKVRFKWTPVEFTTGYLLIPEGKGKRPAVVTVFYEPETAIGLGKNPHRDFALQLARRGFIALSIGSTETTNNRTYATYYPSINKATVQPLSMLGCAAANAWHVLAQRPEVNAGRIGLSDIPMVANGQCLPRAFLISLLQPPGRIQGSCLIHVRV